MIKKGVLPKAVLDEFKMGIKNADGAMAKRDQARKLVYSRLVGQYGAKWWSQNREAVLEEMGRIDPRE